MAAAKGCRGFQLLWAALASQAAEAWASPRVTLRNALRTGGCLLLLVALAPQAAGHPAACQAGPCGSDKFQKFQKVVAPVLFRCGGIFFFFEKNGLCAINGP